MICGDEKNWDYSFSLATPPSGLFWTSVELKDPWTIHFPGNDTVIK